MSVVLIRKTLHDAAIPLAVLATAAIAFEVLLVSAFSGQAEQLGNVLQSLTFAKRMVETLFGQGVLANLTPTTLLAIGLAHPLLYAFTWTLLLAVGTRALVGEVDRGTADLLLSLPASRTTVFTSISATMLICCVVMSIAPAVGLWLGQWLNQSSEVITTSQLTIVALNLAALNAAVAGLTLLVSSFGSRRGVAVAVTLAVLLGSFLLGFLAQVWDPARRIAFLTLLHYYRPVQLIGSDAFPTASVATLAVFGLVTATAGWLYFRRRDIPAA